MTVAYGYLVKAGYMGRLADGTMMLFPTEDEYISYISEQDKEEE